MSTTTNTTRLDDLRNPWTGEPLPPLPAVSHPENWKFRFEKDGDMYCIYEADEHAPMALTFDVYAWDDGKLECDIVSWKSDPLDPEQLEKDARRMPEWIAETRAITQWAHQAFGHKTAGGGDKCQTTN
ncbi:MAG TPA: hypothetical protein K8W03_01880 [Bifidobacterium pseudolongum subsp. globosum]|nr:hypothetical protein [Bifidobacterium pseudolongum subsp. globosum]